MADRNSEPDRRLDRQPPRRSVFGLGMWHGNAPDPPRSPDPPIFPECGSSRPACVSQHPGASRPARRGITTRLDLPRRTGRHRRAETPSCVLRVLASNCGTRSPPFGISPLAPPISDIPPEHMHFAISTLRRPNSGRPISQSTRPYLVSVTPLSNRGTKLRWSGPHRYTGIDGLWPGESSS